jgi:hypothetical protein
MSNIQVPSGQEFSMQAVIIRKDGTRVPLGTIHGGNLFQKVDSFLRIKAANFKQWLQS